MYEDFEIFLNKVGGDDVDAFFLCAGEDDDVDVWRPSLELRDHFWSVYLGMMTADGLVMFDISEEGNILPHPLKNIEQWSRQEPRIRRVNMYHFVG
jgi:hypothetical protein